MAENEEIKNEQECKADESKDEGKKDETVVGELIHTPTTIKERALFFFKVLIAGIIMGIMVKAGLKIFVPFIRSLFTPITEEDLFPPEEPPEDSTSKLNIRINFDEMI